MLGCLFAAAIAISSGVFSLEVFDYVGTITLSRQIDVSIVDMVISPLGEELQITLIFVIVNPTAYSRIKFHYIYYQLYLNMNGGEELIGAVTYFAHEPLMPHKEASYKSTLHISKDKNQYLSTYGSTSELQWRIRCVIHLETPIKKCYQTLDIFTTNTCPP